MTTATRGQQLRDANGQLLPNVTEAEIIARCEELHAEGKHPSFIAAGLDCDPERFRAIRDPWMEANGIPPTKRGQVKGFRVPKPCGQHSAVTRDEIEARCAELHRDGHYPYIARSGLACSRKFFNLVRDAWLERSGIPRRKPPEQTAAAQKRVGVLANTVKPEKIAIPELDLVVTCAGPLAQLDKPKRERPVAGSVAEAVWMYWHSRWRRPTHQGARITGAIDYKQCGKKVHIGRHV